MSKACVWCVLCVLAVACMEAKPGKHPMPLDTGVHDLGVIGMGRFTFPVKVDDADYLICDTIRVVGGALSKEQPAYRNRLGIPAYVQIETAEGNRLKLSMDDLMRLKKVMRPKEIYRLEYGLRDPWYAAAGVYNVVSVQRLVPWRPK